MPHSTNEVNFRETVLERTAKISGIEADVSEIKDDVHEMKGNVYPRLAALETQQALTDAKLKDSERQKERGRGFWLTVLASVASALIVGVVLWFWTQNGTTAP